jgi:hypothetical protein
MWCFVGRSAAVIVALFIYSFQDVEQRNPFVTKTFYSSFTALWKANTSYLSRSTLEREISKIDVHPSTNVDKDGASKDKARPPRQGREVDTTVISLLCSLSVKVSGVGGGTMAERTLRIMEKEEERAPYGFGCAPSQNVGTTGFQRPNPGRVQA